MPAIEPIGVNLVLPAWSSPSLWHVTPKWPSPNTPRIDGRLRWPSDPNFYPISTRYVLSLNCAGSETDPAFARWFWFDIHHDSGLRFVGDTGLSPTGERVEFSIEYYDVLPHLGVPGVRQEITCYVRSDPPVTRVYEWTNEPTGYPLNYIAGRPPEPQWQDPGDFADVGGNWIVKYTSLISTSECYPADQLTTDGVQEINMLNGVSLRPVTKVITSTASAFAWENPDREAGGIWFDQTQPDPRTQIIVPAPFNLVWLTAQAQYSPTTQFASLFFQINGAAFNYRPVASERSCTGNPQSMFLTAASGGWIPVTAGDIIEVMGRVPSGTVTLEAAQSSWLHVIGVVG